MVKHDFDISAPIIVLEPEIKGHDSVRTLKVALDTGATYMMIPWEIAEVLGYAPELSKERIDMTTASGVEKVPLITLKSVSVLGMKAEDVKVAVHDLPQRSYVDGLLGLSFLKNFRICLDFRQGILEIDKDIHLTR